MADRIKGITIELDGDTTKLSNALKGVNKEIRDTQSNLKDVNKLLKMDPGNADLLAQKQKYLTDAIDATKRKLAEEKEALAQLKAGPQTEETQKQQEALTREIEATKQSLEGLEDEYKKFGSVASQQLQVAGDKMKEVGGKISDVGEGLTKGITVPVAAAAGASVAAWKEVDEALDTVTEKTGASGAALEDMQKRAKSIAETIPTDFQTAGDAIGEVNTRFGLTGDALEELSTKFVEFATLNSTDVSTSVDNVSSVLNAFGQDSSDAGNLLDALNQVGQATGVSMDTLSQDLSKNAGQFQAMGLSAEQAAGFMGAVEMSGLDTSTMLTGLTKAQKVATKNGQSLSDASFANGNMTFSLYADNNIESWRTFLSLVAQAVACNVFADREGKIIFRPYNQIPVDTIDAAHRFTGCTFGDYVTRYTGLSCVDIAAQETKYYGEDTDDALTYNLGENPFLQNGDVDVMRKSILTALGSIQYVPFKAEMIGNPAYDLMDVFRFTGGHADDNRLFCMTKFVFSYNQKYEMSGVGKNPALITRNSKSDKDISGLVDEVNSITSSINSLLYDYNTGTLSFSHSERIAGCISYYISKEADVEGHFLMHYRTDQSTTMIVRVYDTTVEELYSPLIYDLPAGDGTIGIPHSYLHRVAGNHEALITVQCTIGTIEVQPRGIFFTINAGNFAEAVDEIGMDIRDISMRQLSESDGPDQIWCAGIENGKLLISRREYKSSSKSVIKWEGVYTPGEALNAAIEFDGSWVLRTGAEKFTIETDDQPWIFWIADKTTRTLYAQKGDDETTRFVAAEGVKSVHACKGYSSEMYPEQDQGLVLLYVKTDGSVFYRQYTLNTETKTKIWSNETEIGKGTEWLEANVHRLNDYRLSFELTSASENHWMITGRTYVGQSVYPENADFNDNNKIGISMFRNRDTIDFTGKAMLFDDPVAPEKVFRIRYPYDIKAFDSSYRSAVTVTLNGKELSGNSYTLSLDGTDLVITTKDEVAATRAKEAVLQVDISAEDTPFYLSNGNGVNRLLLYDQSFSWTIERNITVKNIEIEETVGIHIAATSAITTHQVQNQASIQPDEGTLHAAMTSSFITRQVKETKMTVSDEGELKASVTAEIKTYMTSDAPI